MDRLCIAVIGEAVMTGFNSEDQIRLLIVYNAYSEIEFYYYVLAYVHTVYIHANTCTLAINRDHTSYR